jgi:acetyl-CoA synthetase
VSDEEQQRIEAGWDRREPRPRVADPAALAKAFRWEDVRRELERSLAAADAADSGFNLGVLAVAPHATGEQARRTAIHWVGADGREERIDFAQLRDDAARFANVLRGLPVGPGEVVATLLGRVPTLYPVALGILQNRSLFCPLFSAFGPEPVRQRLALGRVRVLVTSARLYERVVAGIREALPDLEHVLIVDPDGAADPERGVRDLPTLLRAASTRFRVEPTHPEDPAILHFTSGTTGVPKGVVHAHAAGIAHFATSRFALDLGPGDRFWCTADPGWVTGTSYGIVAPLLHGATSLVLERDFEAEAWYRAIETHRVELWYTSPTAIRMLMRLGPEIPARFDLSSLRMIASVGEPLNPEAVRWGQRTLGLPILDNWWQTETGGIMIANLRDQEIRPGSMGRPLPGIEARLVQRRDDGHLDFVDETDGEGEIALREGWPSMMRTYLDRPDRYRECFCDGWYLSEDLARRDADGFFWFVGRADDMIKTAGHRIGPFEIESVLMEHPAVAEAAAIGKPHPTAGDIVKAFVVLKEGYEASPALERALLGLSRSRLGAVSAPREIEIRDRLPKNRAGKIMRRILRLREIGADVGDTSTLEDPTA